MSATNDPFLNRYKLPGVADPLLPGDIANKNYVDTSPGNTFGRVVKKVTQTVNNSSVLVDDDELFMLLTINKIYSGILTIYFISGTTPDFKYNFALPAGATGLRLNGHWISNFETGAVSLTTQTSVNGQGSNQSFQIPFTVIMGGTPGDVQFRWSQFLADNSDTDVIQGSSLVMYEELP